MITNGKTKILIVDDEEKVAQVLRIRLKAAGYEVVMAANGVEGLKLAEATRPDLAILDICMPMGSGPAMAYRLHELSPEVPVIFVTGNRDEGLRGVAGKLGAVAVFEKPYEFWELKAAIEQTLHRPAAANPRAPSN